MIGAGRGTARFAVRFGTRLVDPWGPSRLRRWLHVTGARFLPVDVLDPVPEVGVVEPAGTDTEGVVIT